MWNSRGGPRAAHWGDHRSDRKTQMPATHSRRHPNHAAPWRLVPAQPRCTPQAWMAIAMLCLFAVLAVLGPVLIYW